MRHEHPIMTVASTARIETYSDAVIAIIITVLVLDLHVPPLADASVSGVLSALRTVLPQFLSFAFSFLTVSIFWVNHHHFFHELDRSDGRLLWFNNLLLFWLALIPFTTSFLGAHPFVPGVIMLYCFVLFMGACSFSLMTWHALFPGKLVHDHIGKKERVQRFRRALVGVACYALATLFAPFITSVSVFFMILMPLYFITPRLMHDHEAMGE